MVSNGRRSSMADDGAGLFVEHYPIGAPRTAHIKYVGMKRGILNAGVSGLGGWSRLVGILFLGLAAGTWAAEGPDKGTNTSGATWKVMEDYFGALAKNQLGKAAELAPQVMQRGTNDWNALNFFSWRIFADRGIKHRDRALALAAAERAMQLTAEKEPTVLDTYAKALFENGRQEEAIRHQKRAVELCTVEAKRIEMEANLNRYVRLTREKRKGS